MNTPKIIPFISYRERVFHKYPEGKYEGEEAERVDVCWTPEEIEAAKPNLSTRLSISRMCDRPWEVHFVVFVEGNPDGTEAYSVPFTYAELDEVISVLIEMKDNAERFWLQNADKYPEERLED